ncbi:hypothetical protein N836_00795 [Leptolyngbya sp. Heron Island J]|uniref:hypothetical protein n=1 Tax=Leptolyngbya sp. Heron Island J TaxID=1385935 RepID=UPI0003B96F0C|nr:hypothetical protein [Leptolyngbya sp. Heron Island J]ESA36445.1 hypothetical protein N836_00795 [Leptolyngbya sp. Heron Island J]
MFFEVLSAINDPNQQASISQLEHITQSIEKVASSQGFNPHQMQLMMTILGGVLQPVLKQKQAQLGAGQLASMLGRSNDVSMLTAIISPQQQQQLAAAVANKTGMQAAVAQAMIPQLLPLVISLFNMGAPTPGSVGGTNSLLSTFLDSNRTSNTDLGNVMRFANRFLSPPN